MKKLNLIETINAFMNVCEKEQETHEFGMVGQLLSTLFFILIVGHVSSRENSCIAVGN